MLYSLPRATLKTRDWLTTAIAVWCKLSCASRGCQTSHQNAPSIGCAQPAVEDFVRCQTRTSRPC